MMKSALRRRSVREKASSFEQLWSLVAIQARRKEEFIKPTLSPCSKCRDQSFSVSWLVFVINIGLVCNEKQLSVSQGTDAFFSSDSS